MIPDASNTAVFPLGMFEQRITVPVQSYVWAFAAYCEQAAGFKVQIYDLGTRSQWFSEKLAFENLSGQGTTPEGIVFPLYILPTPRLVIEPAVLWSRFTTWPPSPTRSSS